LIDEIEKMGKGINGEKEEDIIEVMEKEKKWKFVDN
jgi:ATP-dependent Lon protease